MLLLRIHAGVPRRLRGRNTVRAYCARHTAGRAGRRGGPGGANATDSGALRIRARAVPDPLPAQPPQRVTGTCQLAHLGRVTYDFVQVIDFTASPVTFTTTTLTFTAPNGDVLRASGVGAAFPNAAGFAISGTYTFAGGTGRFTDATGYVTFVGQAAVPAFTATLRLDGEIAYAVSDGSGR